jgi:hypothetical protein
VHEREGTCLRLPLADGSEITISSTTADHGGWVAAWGDATGNSVEIYYSAHKSVTYGADTTELLAAVLECAREHRGRPVLKDVRQQTRSSALSPHT